MSMFELLFGILMLAAFLGGGLLFFGLNIYSKIILTPKMRKKGIIDNHEAFWAVTLMTPIPALRDYLENNQDAELSDIYRRLHILSKLAVWLVGGSLFLVIIRNIIESI